MKQITVIGAGEMGTALGKALEASNDVFWYDRNREKAKRYHPLEQVFGSELVFLCVPSKALKDVLSKAKPMLNSNTGVVCLSKGMDEQGRTVDAIVQEFVEKSKYALLAGPMLAEELVLNKTTIGILACKDQVFFHKVEAVFRGSQIKLEYTNDVAGTAISSVLKNIYAMALGMAEASGWGINLKSWLVAQILKEMIIIADDFGGKHSTVLGPAGVGDLVATGFSSYSQNFQVGKDLALMGQSERFSEGLAAVNPLYRQVSGHMDNLPVLTILYQTINSKERPVKLMQNFINSRNKLW
jgi:glycerol-3-phosphate dehydrogenase (NAD(P)+)